MDILNSLFSTEVEEYKTAKRNLENLENELSLLKIKYDILNKLSQGRIHGDYFNNQIPELIKNYRELDEKVAQLKISFKEKEEIITVLNQAIDEYEQRD